MPRQEVHCAYQILIIIYRNDFCVVFSAVKFGIHDIISNDLHTSKQEVHFKAYSLRVGSGLEINLCSCGGV